MSLIPVSPRNLKINIIVSPEDYEHLNQFKWYISNNYIITKIKDSNGKYFGEHGKLNLPILS